MKSRLEHVLDRAVSVRALMLAFPLAFAIHDGEEVLTAERFWHVNRDRLPIPAAIRDRITVRTSEVAVAVTMLFVAVCWVSARAATVLRPGRATQLFTIGVSVLFLNVFTHVGQALMLRRYTPGVVSAVLVALPYTAYTLGRLRREGLVDGSSSTRSLRIAALVGVPLAAGAQVIGRMSTRLIAHLRS